jgi:hypothetical protein
MRFFNPIALVILAATAHHAYAVIDLDECVAEAGGQCGFSWFTLECCKGECVFQEVGIIFFFEVTITVLGLIYCL